MRAVVAKSGNNEDPLAGLFIGEHPDPVVPDGWVRVAVKAAALNNHDVWTLRGVATAAENLPIPHSEQADDPAALLYLPASQIEQSEMLVAPTVFKYVPTAQASLSAAPPTQK